MITHEVHLRPMTTMTRRSTVSPSTHEVHLNQWKSSGSFRIMKEPSSTCLQLVKTKHTKGCIMSVSYKLRPLDDSSEESSHQKGRKRRRTATPRRRLHFQGTQQQHTGAPGSSASPNVVSWHIRRSRRVWMVIHGQ